MALKVDVNGGATNDNEAVEVVSRAADGLSRAGRGKMISGRISSTWCQSYQELPPTPMTERGLQVRPTWPVMGPRTMPRRPAKRPTTGLLADWTLLPVRENLGCIPNQYQGK